ncbi:hypothetical protein NLU14_01750 [Marinobacter sp. 71-i]|uniref:UDP-3-O-(3-hydroxymyristoyl)glucosamine N-acyltransferase n=1 Tax=Marinobacter iranensis TaxID=2962607 RepID=A0ABT5Y5K8_9GAMM|nr:hypothetical protein [Marinobacter iranensis]MDF0748951.1 hypothetical protein [Marinobacter iranensis]
MTQPPLGTYFRTPVSAGRVIAFLTERHSCQIESASAKDLLLEGICDSRDGGQKQLAFSSYDDFPGVQTLTESLVVIENIPDKRIRGSNEFCMVADPRAAFMDALCWLIEAVGVDAHRRGFTEEAGISPEAQIAPTAVIEPGVEVGAGSIISAGVVLKTGTRVGENSVIRENVVIGSDGVTVYRAEDGRLLKFPHVGGVYIGSNTEVGACAVIAGGILASTHIGNDVVVGNLCNIGHGAVVEDAVWMSVGSLLGGHTRVHAGATIAMGVTIRDNLVIGESASLGMGSVVVKNVEAKHSMFGNPAKRMIGLKTGPKR